MKASKFKTHKGETRVGLELEPWSSKSTTTTADHGWVFGSRSVGVQQPLVHGWTRSSFLAMAGRSTAAADHRHSSRWLDATRQQHGNSRRSNRWLDSQHNNSRSQEGENVFLLLEGGLGVVIFFFFLPKEEEKVLKIINNGLENFSSCLPQINEINFTHHHRNLSFEKNYIKKTKKKKEILRKSKFADD